MKDIDLNDPATVFDAAMAVAVGLQDRSRTLNSRELVTILAPVETVHTLLLADRTRAWIDIDRSDETYSRPGRYRLGGFLLLECSVDRIQFVTNAVKLASERSSPGVTEIPADPMGGSGE